MNEKVLTDDQVKVIVSLCPVCKAYTRTAIKHLMDAKSKRKFMSEVLDYDLDVKTISLIEYRNSGTSFCKCRKN